MSAGVHSIQEAFVNKLSLIKFSKKDHVKEEGSRYNRNHSAHVYNDINYSRRRKFGKGILLYVDLIANAKCHTYDCCIILYFY